MKWIIAGVILVGILSAVLVVREKVRKLSQSILGTSDIVEGINRISDDVSRTPKSVSGMTRIMEPQIKRDFPEFVWEQFKNKAEIMLVSALNAISSSDMDLLVQNASDDVKEIVRNRIEMNEMSQTLEHYEDIKVHQTEISNYKKVNGKCIVYIQSAVSYIYTKTQSGKMIEGTDQRRTQTKYNMELVYIQNVDMAKGNNSIGVTCPNCGAPITNLGSKFCEYCGSGVEPVNIKVWSLQNFCEVDYNHC